MKKYGLSFEDFDPPFFIDNRRQKREDLHSDAIQVAVKIPFPNHFWLVNNNIKYKEKSQHWGFAIYQFEIYELNCGKK